MTEQYKAPDGNEYVDFDALDEEPLRFRVKGKLYEVESDLPAEFGLGLRRKMESFKTNEEAMEYMLRQILQEDYEPIKRDAGLRKFTAISEHLMEKLLGMKKPTPEEAKEGNVEVVEEASPLPSLSTTSSSTGHSLKAITGGFGLVDQQTIEGAVG